jgi:hypothetical protein
MTPSDPSYVRRGLRRPALTAALPVEIRFSRKWAIVIIILIALVPAYVFVRIETTPPPVRYIQVSGTVTAAPYGNVTAVVFAPNESIPGYINYDFSSLAVDGKYNVSLPEYYSYVPGADFQSPDGRSGTCWSGNIVNIAQNLNSPMTINVACAPPSGSP